MTRPTTGNDAPSATSVAAGALPEQTGAPTAAEEVIRRIERSSGMLASRAVVRMHDVLPWFSNMSARHRADIQMVVQAGISSFVEWCRRPEHARELSGDVFRVAPRDLVRAVTFRRLVDLVRVAVEAIEAEVPALAGPDHEQRLLADVLRYSRDIAFAGAVVYARAAEERGAWDARLEALVVDHVVRGEVERALPSRAAALGWRNPPAVAVIIGDAPDHSPEVVVDEVHRLGRGAGLEVLTGVHHERLVVIVGGDFAGDQASRSVRGGGQAQRALLNAAEALLPACGPGPVVIGPVAADLAAAASSAHAALAAADVVAAWPAAPRPVTAQALLPERALAGDTGARRALVDEVYIPLREAGAPLLATAGAYLDFGASLEATARALYLHPNTVRYRLRKAADVCGLDPTDHRERFTLHVALILGRLTAT
ncbi:PucR family transcriptional regulator [Frankia sp. Cas8]|uniref:PucR family transcriptional regulator n=2 Tax=Frankia TaxID=1854 RepID=UPI003A103639